MNRWALFGLLCTVAVALFLRVGDLAYRPLHNDEAINAFKLRQLWNDGRYTYDPDEYHGPTLPYASIPVLAVAARFRPDQPDESAMRTVPIVFGVGLVLLLGSVAGLCGRCPWSLVFAAVFTAVSPAMVYYSRYYIHEILLVFFTAGVLAALWRYRAKPGWGWAAGVGIGVGLMYATKETFVLAIAAMIGAGVLTLGTATADESASEGEGEGEGKASGRSAVRRWYDRVRSEVRRIPVAHGVVAGAAALVVAALFFTSFGANPRGVVDAVRTYLPWGDRAGGASPHNHPWDFYFSRLGWWGKAGQWRWSETVVLGLALVGWLASFRGRQPAFRFLGWYTCLLAGIYCIIPYKTPWCALGFLHGILVLAGVGAGALLAGRRSWIGRALVLVAVLVVAGDQARRAWRDSREMAADFRNPFVYGHTAADIFNLLEQIEAVAAVHSEGRRMPIEVMAPDADYWPLPWYLRRFERVGWWDRLVEPPRSPLLVCAVKLRANLEEKTRGAWREAGMFELRPRYFVELYVEAGLWKRFLDARR